MLQKAVLSTVAYYDALDYPVTEFEAWKHLLTPEGEHTLTTVSLFSVARALEELLERGQLEQARGFFVLPQRTVLITERIRREKSAVAKLKRASRLVRFCSFVPYVRMIAITGSLSMKQGDKESDWDFFVILKDGAIWTGRFFLTAWLELLGRRRHGKKVQDMACLNCYLSDGHLEVPMRDLFSSHEYRFLYPVIGSPTFRSFEIANRWMARYRPQFALTEINPLFLRSPSRLVSNLQVFLEAIIPLRLLEPWLSRFQKKLITANPKTYLSGGFIEATDRALIFLPEPKGPQIFERFKERLSRV